MANLYRFPEVKTRPPEPKAVTLKARLGRSLRLLGAEPVSLGNETLPMGKRMQRYQGGGEVYVEDPYQQQLTPEEEEALLFYSQRQGPDFTPQPDVGVLGLPVQPVESMTPEQIAALEGQTTYGPPLPPDYAPPPAGEGNLRAELLRRRGFEPEPLAFLPPPEAYPDPFAYPNNPAIEAPFGISRFMREEVQPRVGEAAATAAQNFTLPGGRRFPPELARGLAESMVPVTLDQLLLEALPGTSTTRGIGTPLLRGVSRGFMGREIASDIARSAEELATLPLGRAAIRGFEPELAAGRGGGATGGGGETILSGGRTVRAIPEPAAPPPIEAGAGGAPPSRPPATAGAPGGGTGAPPPGAATPLPGTTTPIFMRQALADAGVDTTSLRTRGQIVAAYRQLPNHPDQIALRERGVPQPERIPETLTAAPPVTEVGPRPPAEPYTNIEYPDAVERAVRGAEMQPQIEKLKQDFAAVLRGEGPSEVLSSDAIQQAIREGGAVEGGMQTPRNVLEEFRRDPAFVQRGRLAAALENIGVTPGTGTKAELANQLDRALAAQAPGRAMEAQKAIGGGGIPSKRPPAWQQAADIPKTPQAPGMATADEVAQMISETVAEHEARLLDLEMRTSTAGGGRVPPRSEYMGTAVVPPPPPLAAPTFWDYVKESVGAPVALKSILSPPLFRQGLTRLVTNPVAALREFATSVRVTFNEAGAQAVDTALRSRLDETAKRIAAFTGEQIDTAEGWGLKLRKWGPGVAAEEREATFQAYSGKTFIGRGVERISRPSERQMAVELNLHGGNRFDTVANRMIDAGNRDPEAYKALARASNHLQQYGQLGQGDIPLMFSMRAASGRVNLIADFIGALIHPADLLIPGARQEVFKGVVGVVGANMAIIGAVSQIPGVEIHWTNGLPTIQLGPHHYDPWAGWNTIAKLVVGIGKDIERTPPTTAAGWDRLGANSMQRFVEFARKGLGPIPGELAAIGLRRDFKGERYGLSYAFNDLKSGKLFTDLAAPFIAEQIFDAYKEDGLRGVGLTAPASFLSTGVSTYQSYQGIGPLEQVQMMQDRLQRGLPVSLDQRAHPWWSSRDKALEITQEAMKISPAKVPEPVLRFLAESKTYGEFTRALIEDLQRYGYSLAQAQTQAQRYEEALGLTWRISSIRDSVIKADPGIIDVLEDQGIKVGIERKRLVGK